jgi:hypothetical protein
MAHLVLGRIEKMIPVMVPTTHTIASKPFSTLMSFVGRAQSFLSNL